jgi:hypothetical protein
MDKVVPLFKPFITTFYYKFFELGKAFLDRIKFKIIQNKFERI